jgi:predicted MPP superfamily phosphohydrolase
VSSILSFVIFISIFLGLLAGGHYYVWVRLVRDLALPLGVHRFATILIIGLFASILVAFFLGRRLPLSLSTPILMPVYVWLGTLWLLVVVLGVTDLLRWGLTGLGHLLSHPSLLASLAPEDPERRWVLARIFGSMVALVAGGASVTAVATGFSRAVVRRVEIPLNRLPRALAGTKIVQLSDVHIGPTLGRDFIESIVELTNSLSPDVVAITGDLVDGSVAQLGESVEPLAKLRARYGVFFVTGNHEYYSGVEPWCRKLATLGVRVLRNERVSIGSEEASFDLVGIDDYHATQYGRGHGPNLSKAVAGRDPERELVLLAHQPRQVVDANREDVGLQLSGHTHGGQIWPFNFLVKLQQPVVAGLEKIGNTWLYVSSGTGYWGPPMRLGTKSEVTEIILKPALSSEPRLA